MGEAAPNWATAFWLNELDRVVLAVGNLEGCRSLFWGG